MYRYAIIGVGGLGKLHMANLLQLEKERGDICLKAVCGASREDLQTKIHINLGDQDVSQFDFSNCNFYNEYKDLVDNEELDFVLCVLPTFLHEEVAVYCLNKGLHVFSEKPMALTLEGCDRMIAAAKENDRHLMIGQCLRFNPAYSALKEYINSNAFGKVYRAEFYRHSQTPMWTWNNWILDPSQSGGSILDLHIHDVDLINWYFGKPKSLRSVITEHKYKLESVSTQYFYDDLFVAAQADWSLPQTFPFEARCMINFEHATAVVQGDELFVYQDAKSFSPSFSGESHFMKEMKAFLALVIDGKPCEITSPESVRNSVQMALVEIEASRTGETHYF